MSNIKKTTPILLPLLSLVVGIYFQSVANLSIYPILAALSASCLGLTIFMLMSKHSAISNVFAATTFFTLGMFCLLFQTKTYTDTFAQIQDQNLKLIGKIIDKRVLPQKSKLDIAEILCVDVETKKSHKTFSLICYSRYKTKFQVDDKIRLDNIKIKKVKNESLSENTSFQKYLIKEGFLTSIFLTKDQKLELIERPKYSFWRWLWNLKTQTYKDLASKMDKQTFTYFALIFLGNTQQLEITQMRETFNYWGLSHYLARSGLHIVLFILIWTFLFRFIPIRLRWKRSILILICIIYKLLSWSSIPFIRAFYVFLLMEGGKLLDLQTHFLHLLSIVCLLVLIFNPLQLFFLDFQLSFGLTFTLSWALRYF